MICPYCGEEQADSSEAKDDCGEYECEGREKIFRYHRHTTTEYRNVKMEPEDDLKERERTECGNTFRYDRLITIEYSTMKMED